MLDIAADEVRLPWYRPGGNIMRPVNVGSGKRYRGVNDLTLWAAADAKGFVTGVWGTYRQWQHAGAQASEAAGFLAELSQCSHRESSVG